MVQDRDYVGFRMWEDNSRHLCVALAGEHCPPFIAMSAVHIDGATLADLQVVCGQHAQEIADLHARMRETFASLYPQREVPDAVR